MSTFLNEYYKTAIGITQQLEELNNNIKNIIIIVQQMVISKNNIITSNAPFFYKYKNLSYSENGNIFYKDKPLEFGPLSFALNESSLTIDDMYALSFEIEEWFKEFLIYYQKDLFDLIIQKRENLKESVLQIKL